MSWKEREEGGRRIGDCCGYPEETRYLWPWVDARVQRHPKRVAGPAQEAPGRQARYVTWNADAIA